MSSPFQRLTSLDLPGLDDSAVCADGVCAVPSPSASAGEGLGQQSPFDVAERDGADGLDGTG